MNNNKLKKMLESFDENQIAEINRFLNSADGKRMKNNMSDKDKASILKQFENIDIEKAKRAVSGLSKDDIMRLFNQRK